MPDAPGTYASTWRLTHSAGYFGDPVWILASVVSDDSVGTETDMESVTNQPPFAFSSSEVPAAPTAPAGFSFGQPQAPVQQTIPPAPSVGGGFFQPASFSFQPAPAAATTSFAPFTPPSQQWNAFAAVAESPQAPPPGGDGVDQGMDDLEDL